MTISYRPNPRNKVTILVANQTFGRGIHFCSIQKLSGEDADLWFPLPPDADLFSTVEGIMQINGIANNVTRIEPVRRSTGCTDYDVIYNVKP
ncbi:hypothetical protein ABEH06_23915 [Pantoea agglomerans]|uniref:hypothetical protein n=1 Tax=Enterobacter agglomerans TaxID=549 RepID=UPI003207C624